MPSFDFETSISSDFSNDNSSPWVRTSAKAHAGTWSMKSAAIGDSAWSVIFLIADFDAGNVSFWHQTSSESGADFLIFRVDDNTADLMTAGTPGVWTQKTVAISAGVHVLQWFYGKDSGAISGDDAVYIDDIVVPAYTLFDLSNAEKFAGGAIPSGWVNDPTPAEVWSVISDRGAFSANRAKSSSGIASSNSDLEFTADAGASSGTNITIYSISSELNGDIGSELIDSSTVSSSSGNLASTAITPRGLMGSVNAVAAGARNYKFRYNKDSGVDVGDDTMHLYMVFEPGMNSGGPTFNPVWALGEASVIGGPVFA